MELNLIVIEDGGIFRCFQIVMPANPQARQRDADTLTMYIPKSENKVVLWKDGCKLAFDI